MSTNPEDMLFDLAGVRKGTRVWVLSPLNPPVNGGTSDGPLPVDGEGWGGASDGPLPVDGERSGGAFIPIEAIQPGNIVLGHDGKPHPVLRAIRHPYHGRMLGIQHNGSPKTLWVTKDERILCQKRTLSYGAGRSWRHVPKEHFQRARALRKEMTLPERRLWKALRAEQLGVKFRKQHPIGPYIADFYSWEAGIVIEVDGDSHFTDAGQEYDRQRDVYLASLGLTVLRFKNQEVSYNIQACLYEIEQALQKAGASDDHYRQWRSADGLQAGDVIYFGAKRLPIEIANLACQETNEEVYGIEVEGTHSFLTEVCIVHNSTSPALPFPQANRGSGASGMQ
jgi:adenine-specific DNA-methyltransferase